LSSAPSMRAQDGAEVAGRSCPASCRRARVHDDGALAVVVLDRVDPAYQRHPVHLLRGMRQQARRCERRGRWSRWSGNGPPVFSSRAWGPRFSSWLTPPASQMTRTPLSGFLLQLADRLRIQEVTETRGADRSSACRPRNERREKRMFRRATGVGCAVSHDLPPLESVVEPELRGRQERPRPGLCSAVVRSFCPTRQEVPPLPCAPRRRGRRVSHAQVQTPRRWASEPGQLQQPVGEVAGPRSEPASAGWRPLARKQGLIHGGRSKLWGVPGCPAKVSQDGAEVGRQGGVERLLRAGPCPGRAGSSRSGPRRLHQGKGETAREVRGP